MNKLLLLFLSLIFAATIFAQNGSPVNNGGRAMAMGNTGVTNRDITSVYSNQAGLAYLTSMQAGVFGSSRFLLADLNSTGAAFAYPTNSGTFGVDVNYFGFEGYNEQSIGLAFGRKLFDKLAIGGKAIVHATSIPEYGNATTFTFALGFYSKLMDQVYVAGHIFNPIKMEIAPNELFPTNLRIGITYLPSKKTTLSIEAEQDLRHEMRIKTGLEYKLIKELSLRFGMQTQPVSASFGIGLDVKYVKIDIASQYHQVLGFTPGISVIYSGKKRKNLK